MSFNYDTLIDKSLQKWARGIWHADSGYGFDVARGADAWSARDTPGPFPNEPLRLLKPHGSLHWTAIDQDAQTLALHKESYRQSAAKENVIPPTWDKTVLSQWPWKPVWEEASRYLQRVRCLVVVGYSVPPTDLMSQALLQSSIGDTDLRLLVVVNPDADARGRVVDLASAGITGKTRIIELGALRDFAMLLGETADERRRRAAVPRTVRSELRDLEEQIEDLRFNEVAVLEDRVDALED